MNNYVQAYSDPNVIRTDRITGITCQTDCGKGSHDTILLYNPSVTYCKYDNFKTSRYLVNTDLAQKVDTVT